jgi:hypothetical protein
VQVKSRTHPTSPALAVGTGPRNASDSDPDDSYHDSNHIIDLYYQGTGYTLLISHTSLRSTSIEIQTRPSSRLIHESPRALNEHERQIMTIDKLALAIKPIQSRYPPFDSRTRTLCTVPTTDHARLIDATTYVVASRGNHSRLNFFLPPPPPQKKSNIIR